MSDLTQMAEAIQEAMLAVEEAHIASKELKKETNHVKFDEFLARMAELHEHLSKLKMILDNEQAYAMDELMDALSKAYSSHRADFRRTPRMGQEK